MEPPGFERRKVDGVQGRARLAFPDGEIVFVRCEIIVEQEIQDSFPFRSNFKGRIWKSRDRTFASRHIGKDCILEIGDRKVAVWISSPEGEIEHRTNTTIEGFPTLKG